MSANELARQDAVGVESSASYLPWVDEIPENRRRHLRIWLWAGAVLTATTLVVGGITRLTESGLSIVDWAPIVGAVPPLSDADWHEAFSRYQQYPEYVKLRPNMTLGEFKFIYFWEYLHRMIGRLIGTVFLIPFIWFLIRGYFTGPLVRRVLVLFVLGGLQGLMGWYMVKSGLVDRPDVSHYRLAAHLLLAMAIFGTCIWFVNDLLARPVQPIDPGVRRSLLTWLIGIGAILVVQIFWGALVAGLKAGFIYETFPLMDGSLLPPHGWYMDPVLINLTENMATVQWVHRLVATILLATTIAFYLFVRKKLELDRFHRWAAVVLGLIALQYALGVATLLSQVRVYIAVTHQTTALVIVGVVLTFLHLVLQSHSRSRVS